MPPIFLSDATSYLGICRSKVRRHPDGRVEHYDFQLRFNTTYDLPESVVEDTVIHEMIHYFILYHGLQDSSPHGQIFKAIMKQINAVHGRNLSVSHRVSAEQKAKAKSARPSWHVIAVMQLKGGITGFKVLPRVIPKILEFHRKAESIRDVREIRLYLHNNPFFNRYPTSVAMRYHEISAPELERELQGAKKLIVDGNKLIQR